MTALASVYCMRKGGYPFPTHVTITVQQITKNRG